MTATINYDRHVENLIDRLSATGHVTHSRWKKTSVTLHHNGGTKLTHEQILNLWKSRPASAHFDVDAQGGVAQYVDVNEYAWAVGNTAGNQSTISIEMADISSNWEVAEVTLQSAARLAGWLFAHVVGERPTQHNFFPHRHWSSTDCPGPHVLSAWDNILKAAQEAYDHFKGGANPPAHRNIVKEIQRLLDVDADGRWGIATDHRARLMRAACMRHLGYPHNSHATFDVVTVQRIIGTKTDGVWGPKSQELLLPWLKHFQHVLGVSADGRWGAGTDARYDHVRNNHLVKP